MRRICVLRAMCLSSLATAACFGVSLAQQPPGDRLDGWKYPGATHLGSAGGNAGISMILATTDSLEKVAAFYGKKVGAKLSADRPGGMGLRDGNGEFQVLQDDSLQPGAKVNERPVVVRIFVEQTKDHYLTLVITRAKGEGQTHISVTRIGK